MNKAEERFYNLVNVKEYRKCLFGKWFSIESRKHFLNSYTNIVWTWDNDMHGYYDEGSTDRVNIVSIS